MSNKPPAMARSSTGRILLVAALAVGMFGVNPCAALAYDISTAVFDEIALSVAAQEAFPIAMLFNSTGTVLYVMGADGDINAYTLSTPYNISTGTFDETALSVAAQDTAPNDMLFNDDGTVLYVMGETGDDINAYTLFTPYDISTGVFDEIALSVAAQETSPTAMLFNNDGTALYVMGVVGDDINAYTLSTPYDISTGVFDEIALSVAAQETGPNTILFNDDGTVLYVMGNSGDDINAYTLSTPYNISTGVFDEIVLDVSAQEANPWAILFNNTGTVLYVMGYSGDDINAYTLASSGDGDWYSASWPYRVELTVDADEVDADLTDFPVYVDLSDLPAGFHTNVKSDGGDIRVTTSDGTTEVPREVVFYDAGTDTGELHFKGTLANSTDTVFYIYYGNSGASDYAIDATNGAENVWTSSYKAVYHLQQDPSGTVLDSTANDNDLTGANMASGNQVTAVLAGNGYSFDGSNEQLTDSDQVWSNADDAITVQFWNHITAAAAAETNHTAFRWTTSGNERASAHAVWANSIYFDFGTCCTNPRATGSYTAYDDKWTMIHFTSNGSTQVRTFLDGVKTYFDDSTADNPNTDLTGFYLGSGASAEYHEGSIDEFRVSTVARSEEWVATEYNNQSAPGTFYSVGSQEEDVGEEEAPARVIRLKGGIRLLPGLRLR